MPPTDDISKMIAAHHAVVLELTGCDLLPEDEAPLRAAIESYGQQRADDAVSAVACEGCGESYCWVPLAPSDCCAGVSACRPCSARARRAEG